MNLSHKLPSPAAPLKEPDEQIATLQDEVERNECPSECGVHAFKVLSADRSAALRQAFLSPFKVSPVEPLGETLQRQQEAAECKSDEKVSVCGRGLASVYAPRRLTCYLPPYLKGNMLPSYHDQSWKHARVHVGF